MTISTQLTEKRSIEKQKTNDTKYNFSRVMLDNQLSMTENQIIKKKFKIIYLFYMDN